MIYHLFSVLTFQLGFGARVGKGICAAREGEGQGEGRSPLPNDFACQLPLRQRLTWRADDGASLCSGGILPKPSPAWLKAGGCHLCRSDIAITREHCVQRDIAKEADRAAEDGDFRWPLSSSLKLIHFSHCLRVVWGWDCG